MSAKCPFDHKLRSDLPPLPSRIAALPVDERGYPVPFFVAYPDGKPDFRVADARKVNLCLANHLCWVCGQRLGHFKSFPIGPMCAVSRTTAEPPSHLECAEWSVKACPFLSRPHMVRREDEVTERTAGNVAGVMFERNPGVTAIWTTFTFGLFPDGKGKMLIGVGDPVSVSWWREGRAATRAEVMESLETGLQALIEVCLSGEDVPGLRDAVHQTYKYLPRA